jgi:hypothetical protein
MSNMLLFGDPDVAPIDRDIGRRILETLHRHYPGWAWIVDVPAGQNVAIVRNLDCDPRGKMGFVIYKTALYGDYSMKSIVFAGGEFLERYKILCRGYSPKMLEGRQMIFEKPQT